VEKFSGVNGGRALDRIARVVGKHRTTLIKAEAIVAAATYSLPVSGRTHLRCGLHTRTVTVCRNRYPKASDISSPPCLLRLLPAGAVAGWGLHPLESAALSRRTPTAVIPLTGPGCPCRGGAVICSSAVGRPRLPLSGRLRERLQIVQEPTAGK